MGADFIQGKERSFKKSWDRGRVERATPDLLTRNPGCAGLTAAAEIASGTTLCKGDHVIVQAGPDGLMLRRGASEIGQFRQPPSAFFDVVHAASGIGRGVVDVVHEMAGVAEITICS